MRIDLGAYSTTPSFVIADAELHGWWSDPDEDGDHDGDPTAAALDRLDEPGVREACAAEVDAATADGSAFAIDGFDDDTDEIPLRLVIGEMPDAAWLARRHGGVSGVPLRVPSGRLIAASAEDFWPGPVDAEPQEIDVPPGEYLVDAFHVRWDDDPEFRALTAQLNSWGGRANELAFVLLGIGGVGMLVALGTPFWALQSWSSVPMKVALIIGTAYWLLAGPIILLIRRLPASRHARAAGERLTADFPATVLWLRQRDNRVGPPPGPSRFRLDESIGAPLDSDTSPVEKQSRLGCVFAGLMGFTVLFLIALGIALVTDWVIRNW